MNFKAIFSVLSALLLLLCGCGNPLSNEAEIAMEELPQHIDFNFHVKPILSDRCYKCHGPDNNARKADFRLDTEAGAFAALADGGHAFVGGSMSRSLAVRRINSQDPEYMMPPPESNLSLSAREIAIISKWVDQGAQWKAHWSFIAPHKTKPPAIKEASWKVQNPIDNFILDQLQATGLAPADEAPRSTWLRRVSLDLTGLPPTVEELEAFLADGSPDAYEKVVDGLLASPHYGERMALDWLDLARYADTHGYQDDGMRNTWPWRDWVIKAYNDNMPYDQFLIWQLAGDLLPNPTKDQLLATCFNRNHPQTQEGGVVLEEYRVEYVADRTNTFGKAFLGLTTECARCHDHKYDPFSQKEYYSLFGFFNNNHDSGIVPYNGEASPTLILPSREAELRLQALKGQMDSLAAQLVPEHYQQELQDWLQNLTPAQQDSHYGLQADFDFEKEYEIDDRSLPLEKKKPDNTSAGKYRANYAFLNKAKNQLDAKIFGDIDSRPLLVEGKKGKALQFRGDAGVRFHKDLEFDRYQPFSVSIWVNLLTEGEAGPIFNKTNGDFEGYRGWICKLNEDGTLSFQLNHVWPDNAIELHTMDKLPVGSWTHIVMAYDGSSRASGLKIYLNGRTPEYEVLTDNLKKSILHGVKGSNWNYLPVLLGRENQKSIQDVAMDELQIYDRQLSPPEIRAIYQDQPLNIKEAPHQEQLEYYLLSGNNKAYNQLLVRITELRKEETLLYTDQPEVMIMKENPQLRPTFVLERGAYDAPLEEVHPNTPAIFPPLGEDLPRNRLGLAQWLVREDHPLTARVAVNRLWAQCFGKGLVVTQEDFGNQGNLPTHPQLLDWLAVDLIEKDWNIKAFLKQMVLSATYRQSSVPGEQTKLIDDENIYYSHYPAHRLAAELIRDQALAASGLLVPAIGGPSVYPYQPQGIWEALATRNATTYKQQTGDSLYRRSMYTIWKRSSPPPSMTSFDAPDRYYCVVRRQNTTTPLQSLVMMNDPQFLEAARMLGERLMKEVGDHPRDQVILAFKAMIGREPRPDELTKMLELYQEEYKVFAADPQKAALWLSSGEHPVDKTLDLTGLASSTAMVATLMNFDEFTIKR